MPFPATGILAQIGRLDALRLYTAANAWFSFDEDELGSLEVGKLADLSVLDRHYLDVPIEEVRETRSLLTIMNGSVVYADGPFADLAEEQAY